MRRIGEESPGLISLNKEFRTRWDSEADAWALKRSKKATQKWRFKDLRWSIKIREYYGRESSGIIRIKKLNYII